MACQRMCPAAEVSLYAYHNPGEEMAQAVSLNGRPYSESADRIPIPQIDEFGMQLSPAG